MNSHNFKKISLSILLLICISVSNAFSGIIYDKNNIIITDNELQIIRNIYDQNYNENLSKLKAIKELVIIKSIINSFEINNPEYLKKIDNVLLKQYDSENLKVETIKNYLRFKKIREEFILNYYRNNLQIEDIVNTFNEIRDLKLPLSNNDCLTIIDSVSVSGNNSFLESFYQNILNKKTKFKISIDKIIYSVCINNEKFKIIENELVKIITKKTESEFNKFVYGK